MSIFLLEIGKRRFYLGAVSTEEVAELCRTCFPNKEAKITESPLPSSLHFRFYEGDTAYSMTKSKGTIVSFIADSGMAGKVDIELVMLEVVS